MVEYDITDCEYKDICNLFKYDYKGLCTKNITDYKYKWKDYDYPPNTEIRVKNCYIYQVVKEHINFKDNVQI